MHTSSEGCTSSCLFFSANFRKHLIMLLRMHESTNPHTHSQDKSCGDERAPVEGSSATVDGARLLLVHLPTTEATAATARQEVTNYGHQKDEQDAKNCTYQETHLVLQDLNTTHTHSHLHADTECVSQQNKDKYQFQGLKGRTEAGLCGAR